MEQCLHLKVLHLKTFYIESRLSQAEGRIDHYFFQRGFQFCTLISIVSAGAEQRKKNEMIFHDHRESSALTAFLNG
jgi:hypothetical protein